MQTADALIPFAFFVVGVMGFIVEDQRRFTPRDDTPIEIFDLHLLRGRPGANP